VENPEDDGDDEVDEEASPVEEDKGETGSRPNSGKESVPGEAEGEDDNGGE